MMKRVIVLLIGCASLLACQSLQTRSPLPTSVSVVSLDTWVTSRGVRIPVTWVAPSGPQLQRPMPLVLLIHGHGGTRHEAGGFTRVADQLAAAGIASVRMDFPGSGDSREPFHQNNLTHMLADIRAAERFALSETSIDPDRVALLGFSMGGRLAALLSDRDDGVEYRGMALWAAAVVNGAGDMVDMLGGESRYASMKATAIAEGYVNFTTFWGQEQQLGAQWFADMETSRPLSAIERFTGALLFVHGSADAVVPVEVSYRAAAAAGHARDVRVHIIEGADHGFGLFDEPDQYSAELVAQTVAFLTDLLQ